MKSVLLPPRREQSECPTKEKDTAIRRYWLAYGFLRGAPFVLNTLNVHQSTVDFGVLGICDYRYVIIETRHVQSLLDGRV